jgi:hypothetical protein
LRQLEPRVRKTDRCLFREQGYRPDRETGRSGSDNGRSRWREVRLRCGGNYRGHHEVLRYFGLIKRAADIDEHSDTGNRGRDRSPLQITASCSQKELIVVSFLETGLESIREAFRGLDRGKVSEQEEGTADLCVLLGTALTFRYVALHPNQLDTGQSIVYEGKVLFRELATIHGDWLRVREQVPSRVTPVPESSALIYIWTDDFRE